MDPETLKAMSEGKYLGLLMMIETITLIVGLASVLFTIPCLVGTACGCFAETRRPARRQMKPVPQPPEPDEDDLLAVLAALDESLDASLTGSVAHPQPTSIQRA